MNTVDQEGPINDSNEISLKELILKIKSSWNYLLSRWLIILIAAIVGGVMGLAYAYFKKPVYTAELSFALQDEKSGGGLSGALGLASQFGIDLGGGSAGGEFSGDNLLELMKSRYMVEKTLLSTVNVDGKRQTLADFYISFNELREHWEGKPGLENIHFLPGADRSKFTLKQDSILGIFHKELVKSSLTVDKLDKKLSIVYVRVNSTNELFAKYFAEILEQGVSDFYIQTKTKKATHNVDILQYQTDSVRRSLDSALSKVATFGDANPNPNPSRQILSVPSKRKAVDVQANTVILGELVKNLEISKMSLLQQTPLIQVIDTPILPLEKEKVGKLKGLILGGIIGVILAIISLFFSKRFKGIMSAT